MTSCVVCDPSSGTVVKNVMPSLSRHKKNPNSVFLEGTVRVFDSDMAHKVKSQMELIISGITSAFGATFVFEFKSIFPPLYNDLDMANLVRRSAISAFGHDLVKPFASPSMGGEDFAYFAQVVPSAFFFVGIASDDTVVHHNPFFHWDSDLALVLSSCFAQVALDFLSV